jgi:hypothetical protein
MTQDRTQSPRWLHWLGRFAGLFLLANSARMVGLHLFRGRPWSSDQRFFACGWFFVGLVFLIGAPSTGRTADLGRAIRMGLLAAALVITLISLLVLEGIL